ncbi:MAG: hypothetical protein IJW82_04920 [Clostridia bacterium]|nr:hypothetical protein [Clostridia bacterium]
MNKKYESAVAKIREWYKEGENDQNILRALYSVADIQESEYIDRANVLTERTDYSDLSDEEFMTLFNKNKFNNFKEDRLKHLFQEMHNRYMAKNGYDVTRNVYVKKEPQETSYGFVNPEDDMLFINKAAIDKAKNASLERKLNQNTVGHCMFFVISHESQHVVQLEKMLDSVLKDNQSEDDAFIGALFTIENTNFNVDEKNGMTTFMDAWESHYDFQFIEHNANYSAYENYKAMVKDEDKIEQTNDFITSISLRGQNVSTYERMAAIERFTRYEIDYFDKHVQDCELKRKYMSIVKDYMKVDEHGNSKFRSKLEREIGELVDVQQQMYEDKPKVRKTRMDDEELGFTL